MLLIPHGKGLAVVLVLGLAACSTKTASVEGKLGSHLPGVAQTEEALGASAGVSIGVRRAALAADSPETSLHGITLELVEWREDPEWHEVGAVATVTPDSAGTFSFTDVPVMSHKPPDTGKYFVSVLQAPDSPVTYGAGGYFNWLREGEVLSLSLPLVTHIQLPLWSQGPAEHQGYVLQLAADNTHGRLVYLEPHQGIGIYDPQQATVDVLRAGTVLEYERGDSRLHVIEATSQALLGLVSGTSDARFVLIDLDVFTDPSTSEHLDLDDPQVAAELAERVTVIDVPGADPQPPEPLRDPTAIALRPTSVTNLDGTRFYMGELGSTFVFDLESRNALESWHDGAILAAQNTHAGHLYFDMPGGILRVRDAATGEQIADLDLGARNLLGIAPFADRAQTIVSYESASTALEHRIAVIGADATVEDDQLASAYLGFTDRFWDQAYDWGTCSQEFFQSSECPECAPRPHGLPFPQGMAELHRVDMFFDPAHQRLVMPHFGASFDLRSDGLFYPRPFLHCSRFDMPDACTGHAFHDPIGQVALVQSIIDPQVVCVMHTDSSDLTIPIQLSGQHSGSNTPAVLPQLGIGFVASEQALTAIHYDNPDAATQPAVRDLRGEVP